MADAAAGDVGLASGLANVSLQLGAAIGIAVLASISASRTNRLLAQHVGRSAALVGGYRVGYLIAAGCIVAAIVLAALVFDDVGVGRAPTVEQDAVSSTHEAEIAL
jgi:hypothetical protein